MYFFVNYRVQGAFIVSVSPPPPHCTVFVFRFPNNHALCALWWYSLIFTMIFFILITDIFAAWLTVWVLCCAVWCTGMCARVLCKWVLFVGSFVHSIILVCIRSLFFLFYLNSTRLQSLSIIFKLHIKKFTCIVFEFYVYLKDY